MECDVFKETGAFCSFSGNDLDAARRCHEDVLGILRGNRPTIAWFKDPASNFLSVLEAKSS